MIHLCEGSVSTLIPPGSIQIADTAPVPCLEMSGMKLNWVNLWLVPIRLVLYSRWNALFEAICRQEIAFGLASQIR
jgi:hypothetical protein